MKKIIFPTFLLITILFFSFYWYEIRPMKIRQNCAEKIKEIALDEPKSIDDFELKFYDWGFKHCLNSNGIKE